MKLAFPQPGGAKTNELILKQPAYERVCSCIYMYYVILVTTGQCKTRGAIHSTKISGLRFENFLVSNGSRPVRTVSFHSTHKTSFVLI